MSVSILLLLCRSGFENDCAAEITRVCAEQGVGGYPRFQPEQGYVEFHLFGDGFTLLQQLSFRALVFARQWFVSTRLLSDLPREDRVTPLLELARELPVCAELLVQTVDTTQGRELNAFSRKLGSALAQTLRREQVLLPRKARADWRMQLLVLSGDEMWLGAAPVGNSSALEGGIQRLKFPADAPSRSTLKLEEAWHWFVPRGEWDERLGGGKKAVDLGAAPGGWTWQLVRQGMFVTAVDNGPMQVDLMESGQVTHLREDAFVYQPAVAVDWMVCDVVDKPARVTTRMLEWAVQGWCREMIFNLKLPMKQRDREVQLCAQRIETTLQEAGISHRLRIRHLYHDREEVTCHLDLRRR